MGASSIDSVSGAGAARVIARAAERTGADFDFLMKTAERESAFDPRAQARTSSAAGMFQFIEQTWLAVMHRHGEKHGFAEAANAIREDAAGRFRIDDPQAREAVLALRFDPEAASLMAGELARENAARLRGVIGREPSAGELYAAHFLGASGAGALIKAVESDPGAKADSLFPAAAAANRPVFYDGARAKTAAELLADLTGGRPVSAPAGAQAGPQPVMFADAGRPSAASWRAGPATALTPAVVEILASLDAPERGKKS